MKHRRTARDPFVLLCLFLILLSSVVACSSEGNTRPAPPQTGDGWETASPAAVGVDEAEVDLELGGEGGCDHPVGPRGAVDRHLLADRRP